MNYIQQRIKASNCKEHYEFTKLISSIIFRETREVMEGRETLICLPKQEFLDGFKYILKEQKKYWDNAPEEYANALIYNLLNSCELTKQEYLKLNNVLPDSNLHAEYYKDLFSSTFMYFFYSI